MAGGPVSVSACRPLGGGAVAWIALRAVAVAALVAASSAAPACPLGLLLHVPLEELLKVEIALASPLERNGGRIGPVVGAHHAR